MKATKFRFMRCVTRFCPIAALMLTMLVLIVSATTAVAQTPVFVPGNAGGCFGNPVDECNHPFVAAIAASGPGTITVTYVSGLVVYDSNGDSTGPNGVPCRCGGQTPLNEGRGLGLANGYKESAALIGVFVPQSRVLRKRFTAIDGTKNAAKVGIMPGYLFFIGTGKSFPVSEAGTLFLGINDMIVGDNSGGFNVTVSVQ
jgi:hypothetical protein